MTDHVPASELLSADVAVSLQRLRARAVQTQSTAFVAERGGAEAAEAGEVDRPVEIMSITKSVVSLVIGQLVDRRLLTLDTSVAEYIPAWRGTPKEKISIAHLIEHTSGLADKPTTEDIYAAGDFVAFATAAELERAPGTQYSYSNRASNLLPEIVKQASGRPLDDWAGEHLFAPLEISDFTWSKDRAGNVQGMSGLCLSARSLARIGRLVLDRGTYRDREVVSRAWVDASTRTYRDAGLFWSRAPRGLGWFLDPENVEFGLSTRVFESWADARVPSSFTDRLRPLEGRFYPSQNEFRAAVQRAIHGKELPVSDRNLAPFYEMTWKANRPDTDVRYGPPRSISANGWGGQYLIAIPPKDLIVVRLRAVEEDEPGNFFDDVNAIVLGVLRPQPPLVFRALKGLFRLLGPTKGQRS
jgi:CubicO group peptidase (beta-lactamase class C family)